MPHAAALGPLSGNVRACVEECACLAAQALNLPDELPAPAHAPPPLDYSEQVGDATRLVSAKPICVRVRSAHAAVAPLLPILQSSCRPATKQPAAFHASPQPGVAVSREEAARRPQAGGTTGSRLVTDTYALLTCPSDSQSTEKKPRVDPKEAAKAKAAESRQAAKAAKLAKEAAGMRKLSAFFKPKAK